MHSRPKWFLLCFSSTMLDLSKEPLVENISICKKYKKRIAEISSSQALKIQTSGIFSGSPGFGYLNHLVFAVMSGVPRAQF